MAISTINQNSLATGVPSASSITTGTLPYAQLPTGSVLQVVSTTKTDVFTSTSTSYVDITGLSVNITPKFTNSKIFVTVSMVAGATPYTNLCAFQLVRNSTPICVGNARGGYAQATVGNQRASYDTNSAFNLSMNYLDSPATISSVTYKVQGFTEGGTFKVNTSGGDASGGPYSVTSASTITVMEIAG